MKCNMVTKPTGGQRGRPSKHPIRVKGPRGRPQGAASLRKDPERYTVAYVIARWALTPPTERLTVARAIAQMDACDIGSPEEAAAFADASRRGGRVRLKAKASARAALASLTRLQRGARGSKTGRINEGNDFGAKRRPSKRGYFAMRRTETTPQAMQGGCFAWSRHGSPCLAFRSLPSRSRPRPGRGGRDRLFRRGHDAIRASGCRRVCPDFRYLIVERPARIARAWLAASETETGCMQDDRQHQQQIKRKRTRLWGAARIADHIDQPIRKTFYLLENRLIPAAKIGKQWVADADELDDVLRGRAPASTGEEFAGNRT